MSERNLNNYKRVFSNRLINQISHSSSNKSNSKHFFQAGEGGGLITGFLHIFHSKIHKLLTLFASCFKIQRPSLIDTRLGVFNLLQVMPVHPLLHRSDANVCTNMIYCEVLAFHDDNVHSHNSQSVKLPASPGINCWLFSF